MAFTRYNWSGAVVPPKKLRRMKRATAETMLAAVIERAKAINGNADLLCPVSELRVFGSYLTDSPSLGDLDIACRLVRRPNWTAEAALARADLMIPPMCGYIRRLTYYETEIKQILREPQRVHFASPDRGNCGTCLRQQDGFRGHGGRPGIELTLANAACGLSA
jgi:hypothetical protein